MLNLAALAGQQAGEGPLGRNRGAGQPGRREEEQGQAMCIGADGEPDAQAVKLTEVRQRRREF